MLAIYAQFNCITAIFVVFKGNLSTPIPFFFPDSSTKVVPPFFNLRLLFLSSILLTSSTTLKVKILLFFSKLKSVFLNLDEIILFWIKRNKGYYLRRTKKKVCIFDYRCFSFSGELLISIYNNSGCLKFFYCYYCYYISSNWHQLTMK